MKSNKEKSMLDENLRKRALAQLQQLGNRSDLDGIEDITQLVEQLNLHHIELEMQGEELRQANENLRRARDLYFQHFIAAPIPVFRVAGDGRIAETNIAGVELLALEWRVWKRHPLSLFDFIEKPRMRARLRDALGSTFEQTEVNEFEIELRDAKGHERVFSVVAQAVSAPDGQKAERALFYLRDVTETRAYSREIERLSLIAKHTASSVIFTDAERRITWCNESFLNLTGYSEAEVRGRNPSFLQGPETDPKTVARMRAALDRGEGFIEDILNYTKCGRPYWIHLEVIPRLNAHGHPEGFFSVQTDITRRLHQEKELRSLRMAVEQSPSTVVITDPSGAITYANPAFERSCGYTVEEVNGKNPRLLKSGKQSSAFYAKMWAELKAGRPWEGVFQNRRKDGTLYWEHANIAPVLDDDARLIAYIAVKRDITEEKEAGERLNDLNRQLTEAAAYAQKMAKEADAANRAKSDFLANMSHEIRTPMNGVLGLSEILAETDLTEEQRELINGVRTSGEVLLATINEILDFSRIEAGRLELHSVPFEMASFFNDFTLAMRPAAVRRGLEFFVDLDTRLPVVVIGDELRIRQVMANLVTNALKFTPKGSVRVKVEVEGLQPEAVRLRISVIDTGIGVPPEKQGFLFREFSQVDNSLSRMAGGSGLGLAISKRLIRMMEGEISVVSPRFPDAPEGERGAEFCFRLTLPLPSPTESSSGEPVCEVVLSEGAAPGSFAGGHILVVEDNSNNRTVARMCLEKLGHTYEEAQSGAEALLAMRERSFHAILMDLRMPGMDGFELTACLRTAKGWATASQTPVIAVTAHALTKDRERCLAAGMNEHLAKPYRLEHLERVLKKWVGEGRRHIQTGSAEGP
ncbi:MAG: PAS domain S-box protein [Opitutales bacterium]|nr:PAS domain S-box protein [Opitutales bacterium]